MATVSDALTFARAQVQTDSNGLTDTKGLIFANEALLDFRRQMIAKGVDAASIQESYTDLVGGTGTYLFPTDMFWLKAIQLNYTNSVAANYVKADQVDVSNIPSNQSFGWLRANASTLSPNFDDHGDWFEVFPTPVGGSSQGIRIIYFQEPTQYTSVNDSIGYPESLGGNTLLGYRIAASYIRSLRDFQSADAFDKEYQLKVKDIINTIGRGSQQPLEAMPIQITGWEF